ncbi:zinc finger MYM-type protein 1-like [Paramormyrops kingsleyae]|uniref:zinc finger MYM-type protein 1-like n=1 Tax=Paramormyrops kingsleyae TaxID=1676925 RepID=UPI003B971835
MAGKRKTADIRSFFNAPKRQAKSSHLSTGSQSLSDTGTESQKSDCSESGKVVEGRNRELETSQDSEDRDAAVSSSTSTGTVEDDTTGHDDFTANTSNDTGQLDACFSSDLSDCTKPYQPPSQCIETQTLSKKTLTFQQKWFHDFPWLHYSTSVRGVLCFYCSKGFSHQSSFGQRADVAFISSGFRNWKKAIAKFTVHQNSQAHCHYVSVSAHQSNPISAQLSSPWSKQQEVARHCFRKIVSSVRLVARQGQAIRGHTDDSGNLHQLLKLRAEEDDPILLKWLTDRKTMYTSPKLQNEILNIMANTVIRGITAEIQALPILQFSVIIDGTQDVTGAEQESVCLRYVDHDLVPHEEFVGLYRVSDTTGQGIAKVAADVLLRLNLPLSGLRGQTYDGAANMAGKYTGAQAILRRQQPLALYVHCGAHCVNLITQAGCFASLLIRDCLSWVHQLGIIFGQSGKFRSIFENIAICEHAPLITLKPLCPTRWTVRNSAIIAVLQQYKRVLDSLEEMAKSSSKTASTASGLFQHFTKGKTVLGLTLASAVVAELECLNVSLQKKIQTVSGMLDAVNHVRTSLKGKRDDESYLALYKKATTLVDSIESIEPIQAANRVTGKAVDYYRAEFFKVLDSIDVQFAERFDQESLNILVKVESALLTGELDDCLDQYPELNRASLAVQLPLFQNKYPCTSIGEAAGILRGLPVEVRGLFDQVEVLIRILMVVPVSSCEAERSFSTLRRLKTWLRATMNQNRLNNLVVCNVHKERLDMLNIDMICQEFVGCSDTRRRTFGSFV